MVEHVAHSNTKKEKFVENNGENLSKAYFSTKAIKFFEDNNAEKLNVSHTFKCIDWPEWIEWMNVGIMS